MSFGEVMSKKRHFPIGAHVKVSKITSSVPTAEFCYHTVKICQIDAMHLNRIPEKFGLYLSWVFIIVSRIFTGYF